MIVISLFSGIGGFEVAAEKMGWTIGLTCDISEFGTSLLTDRYPNSYHHGDIHTLTYEIINYELTKRFGKNWRSNGIILTGGFPCQPYSAAGRRLGKEDDRHLWPEMLRLIREIAPDWILGENVFGIVSWNKGLVFNEVKSDLEACDYKVQAYILPACAVNAPHQRERVWFVAYSVSSGLKRRQLDSGSIQGSDRRGKNTSVNESETEECSTSPNSEIKRMEGSGATGKQEPGSHGGEGLFMRGGTKRDWAEWPTQSPICSGNDGFRTESLRQRIREDSMGLLSEKEIDKIISKAHKEWTKKTIAGAGNAVVPPLVLEIFQTIEDYERAILQQ